MDAILPMESQLEFACKQSADQCIWDMKDVDVRDASKPLPGKYAAQVLAAGSCEQKSASE